MLYYLKNLTEYHFGSFHYSIQLKKVYLCLFRSSGTTFGQSVNVTECLEIVTLKRAGLLNQNSLR